MARRSRKMTRKKRGGEPNVADVEELDDTDPNEAKAPHVATSNLEGAQNDTDNTSVDEGDEDEASRVTNADADAEALAKAETGAETGAEMAVETRAQDHGDTQDKGDKQPVGVGGRRRRKSRRSRRPRKSRRTRRSRRSRRSRHTRQSRRSRRH